MRDEEQNPFPIFHFLFPISYFLLPAHDSRAFDPIDMRPGGSYSAGS